MTKGCHSCKHLDLNPGEPGYSGWTPGSNMSFECLKGHWLLRVGDPAEDMRRGLEHGLTCSDYTPIPTQEANP